jgi:hypothetical protein
VRDRDRNRDIERTDSLTSCASSAPSTAAEFSSGSSTLGRLYGCKEFEAEEEGEFVCLVDMRTPRLSVPGLAVEMRGVG